MEDSSTSSISNSVNMASKKISAATKSKKSKQIIVGIIIFLIIIVILVALYFLIKALTSSPTPAAPAPVSAPIAPTAPNANNSGTSVCPDNSQVVGVIPVEGETIPGSYFIGIKNASNCQDLCNSNAYCQWSTYVPSTGECFLNQGINKANVTSGFRIQDNPSGVSCPNYTTFNNTVISTTGGTTTTASSVADCENQCTNNSCMFFSLDGTQCNTNNGIANSSYITSFPVGNGKNYSVVK